MKLYHISENPDIELFQPRPSPQAYKEITGDIVFAINDKLLHNYLLPRDSPRVTYYRKHDSTQSDIEKFFGGTKAEYILNVEEAWRERIENTILYLYQLPAERFTLLDEGAGYYISYQAVEPISITPINNLHEQIAARNAELRYLPSLRTIAEEISHSTLQFSIIRLRNSIE